MPRNRIGKRRSPQSTERSRPMTRAYKRMIRPKISPVKSPRKPKLKKEIEKPVFNLAECLEESLMCAICHQVLYQPMSLVPCMHTFCNGCYAKWTRESPVCPQCRVVVKEHLVHRVLCEIVALLIRAKPDLDRSKKEKSEMDLAAANMPRRKCGINIPDSSDSSSSESFSFAEDHSQPSTPYLPLNHVVYNVPAPDPLVARTIQSGVLRRHNISPSNAISEWLGHTQRFITNLRRPSTSSSSSESEFEESSINPSSQTSNRFRRRLPTRRPHPFIRRL